MLQIVIENTKNTRKKPADIDLQASFYLAEKLGFELKYSVIRYCLS